MRKMYSLISFEKELTFDTILAKNVYSICVLSLNLR